MDFRKTRLPHINTLLAKSLLLPQQSQSAAGAPASDRLVQQQLQVLDAVEQNVGHPASQKAHPSVFR